MSIISQYFKEVKPFPPSGLGGSDNCIYDVTVNSEGGRTFVTLQGKDMNSFGDSGFVGIDGFQQSLLKSLYRSLSDKRKLICEGYGEYLVECGGGSSLKDRGVEGKKCYITLESNNKKYIKLYTNISVSIVSQYVTKVEKDDPLIKRPLGKSDSCLYEIVIEQTEDTLFTTVTGEGLNSYGDSELSGIKGFQQSLLKSLFRSLRDKRGMICDDYRDLLEECKDVVVEKIPKKVEPVVVQDVPKVEKKGVRFRDTPYSKFVEGGKKWFKTGDKKTQAKYQGDIVNSIPNGQGTTNFPNGNFMVGDHKDGMPWNGIEYDKDGNIKYKWVNGKWIKQ
jgi:hypothetical protein